MEIEKWLPLLSNPFLFICLCLGMDILIGDPQYAWHPVRLMGNISIWSERYLRKMGFNGRMGGILLFLSITIIFGGSLFILNSVLGLIYPPLTWLGNVFLGYSLFALGDLVKHGKRIANATANATTNAATKGNLDLARISTAMLVGRDTDKMDAPACNRAAVESIAESLVDGVLSPLFWFSVAGLPGLVLFKIASTMDSMVGYKNDRYVHFGWFGARLDDVMNYLPSRFGAVAIGLVAAVLPGYSGRKAFRIGWQQHALLPGPNKGWSETAASGALEIRLAGPIYKNGALVNTIWIGDTQDREGGSVQDVGRMITLAYVVTGVFLIFSGLAYLCGWMLWSPCAGCFTPLSRF